MRLAALIVTLLFIVTVLPVDTVSAQEVTPPKGQLTGKHASLDCEMCHQTGVWHTTNKDVKVCQKCHQDQWDTLTKQSMHMALMRNGTIDRDGSTFQVKYCETCHDPHHNDYLRITTAKDSKETYYKFEDVMPLCLNCHSLSDGARPISNTNTMPQNTNTTARTNTTNTTTTKTTLSETTRGNVTLTTKTTTSTSTNANETTTTTTTTKRTTLSLVPSALAAPVSSPLMLQGQIDPVAAGTEVVVKGKSEGNTTWNILGRVTTDTDGKYEITWTPNSVGNFVLMASSGNLESGIYTVMVSEAKSGTGSPSLFLGLFSSPLFLVAVAAVVAVAVVAAFVFLRKKKEA